MGGSTTSGAGGGLASRASLTGATIDRYQLEALIGKGGMGEVYRATDDRLRRKVALKILRPDKDRPDAVARLFREARAAAALTHPNTVAIHDIGESEGLFYIVMELVNGMPLLAYVGDDRAPLGRKVKWLTEVARALERAHKSGVIHRDVKPSNVMVSDEDVAKVLDFGLAKPIDPKSVDFRTQVGRVVGTIRYMSPEQLAGAEADARSDQYALGVTAYELLSGKYPGGIPLSVPESLEKLLPTFPKDGSAVIMRMMQRSPDDRFQSMTDVITALDDVANNRPVRVSLPTGMPAVNVPAAKKKMATMPDTVREPGTSESESAAPKLRALANDPSMALGATMPGTEALALRQAAHARAHEIVTRTLLSLEAPKGISNPPPPTLASPDQDKENEKLEETPIPVGVGTRGKTKVMSQAPPLAAAVTHSSQPPPFRSNPPPAITSYPPPAARSSSSRTLIIVVTIALLAVAAFAGTYLGSRARQPDVVTPGQPQPQPQPQSQPAPK